MTENTQDQSLLGGGVGWGAGRLPATRGLTPGFKPQHSGQGGPSRPQPDLLAFPPRPSRSRVPTTFLQQPRASRLSWGARHRCQHSSSHFIPQNPCAVGTAIIPYFTDLESKLQRVQRGALDLAPAVPCPHPLPKHPVHPRREVWLTPLWGLPTCRGRLEWKLQWRGGRMRGLWGKQVREHRFALLGEGGGGVKR